ncbi:MAG: hypothetical protein AABZ53_00185 [Planctomycetota bacterium]
MSVAVAKANLMDAQKKLRAAWDRARQHWDDDTAKLFAKEVLDPIEPRISAAIKAIDHVQELMVKVRRECGEDASD